MEHTPGPWTRGYLLDTPRTRKWSGANRQEAQRLESLSVFSGFTETDQGRGRVSIATISPGAVEYEANRALIEAAPDLLDACRQALQHVEGDESTHGRPFGAGNALRDAIKKATDV